MFQSVNSEKKPATGLRRNNNTDELVPSKQVNIRPPFLNPPIQKAAEEEENMQAKTDTAAQLAATKEEEEIQTKTDPAQKTENKTGMPDNLKSGVEQLSGYDMSDVRVFYNSAKPAAVQAHAYTQGSDIHVAPGQEKHLPHEVWHAAQQKQGRVQPTTNVNGMPVNDNAGLEEEADVMGAKAVQMKQDESNSSVTDYSIQQESKFDPKNELLGKRNEIESDSFQTRQLKTIQRMMTGSVVQMVGGPNEFATQIFLDDHFNKHVTNQNDAGSNYSDSADYEKAAKAIAEGDYTDTKTVGDNTYFWKDSTKQFVVVRGGAVRSMFVPGRGKAYYDDQK